MGNRAVLSQSLPFVGASKTSRAAAESMAAEAKSLRDRTYRWLLKHPEGATDEQIQFASGMGASTQRPRRIELVRMGLVRDSGITRATRSGRQATVWIAVRPEELA